MILDLDKFLAGERQYWKELETVLDRLENDPAASPTFEELQRFHYLYQRGMAGLAKPSTLAARGASRAEESPARSRSRFVPWRWFFQTFPQTFRRRIQVFWLSFAITMAGCAFGCLALSIDRDARQV